MSRFIMYAVGCVLTFATMLFAKEQEHKRHIQELERNQQVLLGELTLFKAADSLNAVEMGELSLTLREYEKTHENDLKTIKDLRIKANDLASVNKMQLQTITRLGGRVVDTVYWRVDTLANTTTADTARCVKSRTKWLDLDLCVYNNGTYIGSVTSRDSIIVAEEVKYKRFLGFLWRTNVVKERNVKVTSKNPNTKIMGFEFVRIKK